jgi:phenylacetate-CoA ligase
MIKSLIARHLYEPLYYRLYGRFNGTKYYKFLKKAQWNRLEKNRKIQEEMLYNLLDYSSKNIPYYKRLFEERKLKLTKTNAAEILRKLPILDKETVKKEFDNLYVLIKGTKPYKSTSGGTTGKPVELMQDNVFKMKMLVVKKIQKEWIGHTYGDTEIKLWGSERDILHERESLAKKIAGWAKSVYMINAFMMDDKKMREYVEIINRKKPSLILSYARAVNELAKFINENKLKVHSPKGVMTSAGKLYPEFRANIEQAFHCPVYDRYGSREVGDIASECEKHEGLHISMFNHYVEILNKDLKPCKEGEAGDIYITLLTNYTMPLLRYKIGDVGIYTNKTCSCGRGLPLIKEIVGRDLDNFITKDGRILHGGLFVHFIGVVYNNGGIEKFQIIQKDYDSIEINVKLNDKKLFEEKKKEIEEFIRKMMSKECSIKWNFVDDIKPEKSGKFRYTMRAFEPDKNKNKKSSASKPIMQNKK